MYDHACFQFRCTSLAPPALWVTCVQSPSHPAHPPPPCITFLSIASPASPPAVLYFLLPMLSRLPDRAPPPSFSILYPHSTCPSYPPSLCARPPSLSSCSPIRQRFFFLLSCHVHTFDLSCHCSAFLYEDSRHSCLIHTPHKKRKNRKRVLAYPTKRVLAV